MTSNEILPHPPLSGIAAVRNWILDNTPEECVVMIDDDLKSVKALIGKRPRTITEPECILRIIENGIQIAHDLDVPLFCWGRIVNPLSIRLYDPISLTSPVSCSWGMIGREFRCDERLSDYEDMDLTLQCLLKRRILYCDTRFYFDHGPIFSGSGGLQGIRTGEGEVSSRKLMTAKWGKYVHFGAGKTSKRVGQYKVTIERRQKIRLAYDTAKQAL